MNTLFNRKNLLFCGAIIALALLLPVFTGSPAAPHAKAPAAVKSQGTEASTPQPLTDYRDSLSIFRVVGAFVLIMVMIIGLAVVVRRFIPTMRKVPTGQTGQVRIEEKVSLGDKNQVFILSWEDSRYLVGLSHLGFQVLDRQSGERDATVSETTSPEAEPAIPMVPAGFATILSRQMQTTGQRLFSHFHGGRQ